MARAPWFHPAVVAEYGHGALVRLRRAHRGHTRHDGNALEIIGSCIEACWNGRNYTASPGHFDNFWVRDMGFSSVTLARHSTESRNRLIASLDWAMTTFERRRSHVTTTIHYGGFPVDVFDYGIDSLPLLLAAIHAAGEPALVADHEPWIAGEVAYFGREAIDSATGLVRIDRKFSAHRDTVVNRSNAYGNSMAALLARTLDSTGWAPNPLRPHLGDDHGRLLLDHFWDGDHFRDTLGEAHSSGEANVWPFFTGVIRDQTLQAQALAYLGREGYADPLPLRYELARRPEHEVWLTRHLLPDYQGSAIWTSLGAIYLWLLHRSDPVAAAGPINRYVELVERDGTFWEVLGEDLTCWVSSRRVVIGEESMLWSAIFRDLLAGPDLAPPLLS